MKENKINEEYNNLLLRKLDNIDIDDIKKIEDRIFDNKNKVIKETDVLKSIAIRLNYQLSKQKKTAKYLSIDTGIGESTLSEYRKGLKMPSIYNLSLIAKSLNCSIDYLVGFTNCEGIEVDYKIINKMTNLSSTSIDYLLQVKEKNDVEIINALNILLETERQTEFLRYYYKTIQQRIEIFKKNLYEDKSDKKKKSKSNENIKPFYEIDHLLTEIENSIPISVTLHRYYEDKRK